MKRLSDFMVDEYEKRIEVLDETVKEKEVRLKELNDSIASASRKNKFGESFTIEKANNGIRVFAHKSNDALKIFNSEGEEITKLFPKIAKELFSSSPKDFIVDGDIISNDKVNAKLYLSDIIYYAGNDIRLSDWYMRKQILQKFKYSDNVKELPMVVVKNKETASQAIDVFSKLPGCTGVTIKYFESKYSIDKNNDDCFCLTLGGDETDGAKNTDTDNDGTTG